MHNNAKCVAAGGSRKQPASARAVLVTAAAGNQGVTAATAAAAAGGVRGSSRHHRRRGVQPISRASESSDNGNGGEVEGQEGASEVTPPPAAPPKYKTSLGDDPAFAAFVSQADGNGSRTFSAVPKPAADGSRTFSFSSSSDSDPSSSDPAPLTPADFDVPTISWENVRQRNPDAQNLPETIAAQTSMMGSTALAKAKSNSMMDMIPDSVTQKESVRSFLYPDQGELPDDVNMTIWEHLDELRERVVVSAGAVSVLVLLCFCFAKDLVVFLEQPVASEGVRFLALAPGEYFFTTVKVAGYCGLLMGAPIVLYEGIAYVLPGLTKDERKFLGPIVIGSSVLFYVGIAFAYAVLTPAALKFFVGYADQAVESLWSIDQYFEFVLVLLFSTGLAFQVPVIQLLLGQTGLVSSKQMLSVWKYVVVGSVVAAAVLTPSTDPFTQMLLAVPLMSLYLGGAALVGVFEKEKAVEA